MTPRITGVLVGLVLALSRPTAVGAASAQPRALIVLSTVTLQELQEARRTLEAREGDAMTHESTVEKSRI